MHLHSKGAIRPAGGQGTEQHLTVAALRRIQEPPVAAPLTPVWVTMAGIDLLSLWQRMDVPRTVLGGSSARLGCSPRWHMLRQAEPDPLGQV